MLADIFRVDPNYLENEEKYNVIKREILGEEEEDEEEGEKDGDEEDEEEEEESEEEDEEEAAAKQEIKDQTETNLVNLRRTIYLTIMASVNFEEAGHKLMRVNLQPGQEVWGQGEEGRGGRTEGYGSVQATAHRISQSESSFHVVCSSHTTQELFFFSLALIFCQASLTLSLPPIFLLPMLPPRPFLLLCLFLPPVFSLPPSLVSAICVIACETTPPPLPSGALLFVASRQMVLCEMLLACCSQERTYLRYYGLLAQRFW